MSVQALSTFTNFRLAFQMALKLRGCPSFCSLSQQHAIADAVLMTAALFYQAKSSEASSKVHSQLHKHRLCHLWT